MKFPNYGEIENYNVTTQEVMDFFKKAVPVVASDVTYIDWLEVGEDDEHIYAIVIGWSEGFDPADEGVIDGYGLCMKMGYKPKNGILYDFDDWLMPYDEDTGEVWDTDCSISTTGASKFDVEWILKEWNNFYNEYSAQVNGPEAYYEIMNLLDEIALADRFPTSAEKKQLDDLLARDGADIEDLADANDCYNADDELCHTWDEMVSALHILFEHGERG